MNKIKSSTVKNKNFTLSFVIFLMFFSCTTAEKYRQVIDLSGEWKFSLDPENKGLNDKWEIKSLVEIVKLPGTTDENKKGIKNLNTQETTNLSREYTWFGKAWYQREVSIPKDWEGKSIRLTMERTKPTHVWVDSKLIGTSDDISSAQVYDLTSVMTPGAHKITIMVDNGKSVPPQILTNSHAYTESTQTNWNGIIGKFCLEAMPLCHINDIQTYPDVRNKLVVVKLKISNSNPAIKAGNISLYAEAWNTEKTHTTKTIKQDVKIDSNEVTLKLDMGDKVLLWDEFNPALYRLNVTLTSGNNIDKQHATFGMREFNTRGTQFIINDKVTFLRGKHDGCVFPLTAYVAMDLLKWREYFKISKEYGINHYRFHSWCPPEECFEAADIEGVYLQPELPFWGSFRKTDQVLISFLTKEGINIQKNYSNHASFVMFGLGNELSGDQEVMDTFVKTFKKIESRHIYSYGSNDYLGFKGHLPGEDYYVTCRVGKDPDTSFVTHARGSFSFADAYDGGYINHTIPNSKMNFSSAVLRCSVPIISHETGQFQIYPNYKEIEKYTGVLKPWNFEVFKSRLKAAGMADQANDFLKASGTWAVLLYKAEIEMDLRTKGFGGFQLLDLQDYPGQGSAFVGILDAFMQSKSLVTPVKWKEFCSEVVPLFETEKFCWSSNEKLTGEIKVANYSGDAINNKQLNWELKDKNNSIIDHGTVKLNIAQGSLGSLGQIVPKISGIKSAIALSLNLSIEGTLYKNSCSVWVYPTTTKISNGEVIVETSLNDDLKKQLSDGKKVLLFPNRKACEGVTVGGLAQTDYWNYRMFKSISERIKKPVSPGTLGILTNPQHAVFANFPTDFHSNWQWFRIIKQGYPMILDAMPNEYHPIVQVIDNIERNHKLGLIFELSVGKGKLLICMSDLESMKDKPEVKQLYASMLGYMNSKAFAPAQKISYAQFKNLFDTKTSATKITNLDNISY